MSDVEMMGLFLGLRGGLNRRRGLYRSVVGKDAYARFPATEKSVRAPGSNNRHITGPTKSKQKKMREEARRCKS